MFRWFHLAVVALSVPAVDATTLESLSRKAEFAPEQAPTLHVDLVIQPVLKKGT